MIKYLLELRSNGATYDHRWTRPSNVVNGGTLMALADVAVYVEA